MALTRKRARTEVDDDDGATIASNPKLAATEVDHVTKNDHASAINNSPAAKFNRLVMRKLTKALEQDPETDITRIVPSSYTATLARRLSTQQDQCDKNDTVSSNEKYDGPSGEYNDQVRIPAGHAAPSPNTQHPVEIIFPISSTVRSCLGLSDEIPIQEQDVMTTLSTHLASAERLFQSQTDKNHYVAKCSKDLVVKVSEVQLSAVTNQPDFTEYTSMQFLAQHKPDFPAPRPHGLFVCGKYSYLFTTYISGRTLENVWNTLTEDQKLHLTDDLNCLILKLRAIPLPTRAPLGGVAGEGCKDARRSIRRARKPLYTTEEFWDFRYGDTRNKNTAYGRVLRQVTFPPLAQKIRFTHGDLHPANIVVQLDDDQGGKWKIGALVDWEMSGFYPEDFECVKATNLLSPLQMRNGILIFRRLSLLKRTRMLGSRIYCGTHGSSRLCTIGTGTVLHSMIQLVVGEDLQIIGQESSRMTAQSSQRKPST